MKKIIQHLLGWAVCAIIVCLMFGMVGPYNLIVVGLGIYACLCIMKIK